jgi:hypothetical protein
MRNKLSSGCCLVLLLLLWSGFIYSNDSNDSNDSRDSKDFKELNIALNYNGSYTENIFLNASAVSDYVSHLNANIDYLVKRFNFFLYAEAGIYADNPDFNSFEVEPGIEWLFSLKNRDSLYINAGYRILNYKDLYADFNFNGPRLQVGVKLFRKSSTILKAGYRFEARNYSTYESFDYFNHSVFLEIKRFFRSQTTLNIEARFNYRHYPHIADDYDFGDDYNYFQQHRYQGNHKGQGPGSGSGPGSGGGNGNGNGPGYAEGPSQTQFTSSSLSIPNINGLFRISQAIGTQLGISGEVQARWNFKGLEDAESLIKNAYILYPFHDNELWNGFRLGLGLKAVVGKAFSLEGNVSYFDKRYPGVFIMDELGEVVEPPLEREDSLILASLRLSRNFKSFDLFADVTYRDNDSNDSYFLYNMITISAGIGFYF